MDADQMMPCDCDGEMVSTPFDEMSRLRAWVIQEKYPNEREYLVVDAEELIAEIDAGLTRLRKAKP